MTGAEGVGVDDVTLIVALEAAVAELLIPAPRRLPERRIHFTLILSRRLTRSAASIAW